MYRSKTSSRVPIIILCNVEAENKTAGIEQLSERLVRDNVGIIEHASGDEASFGSPTDHGAQHRHLLAAYPTCFRVKGDALELLQELAQRRSRSDLAFDGVIVNASTLGDPSALVRALFEEEKIGTHYYIDTVIPAPRVDQHAASERNKGELQNSSPGHGAPTALNAFEAEQARSLMARLRSNASVTGNGRSTIDRAEFVSGTKPEELPISGHDLSLEAGDPQCDAIGSFVFRTLQPFQFVRLGDFMANVLQTYGDDLLRYKGVLNFSGCANRVLFEGAGARMTSRTGPEWEMTETRESTMIFVGRKLPRQALATGLEQCLADAGQPWKW